MIKFGTDGWRAKIAEDFTFFNLNKVTDGYAVYMLKNYKKPSVLVGYDNRFLSEKYAENVAKRLKNYGFNVFLFNKSVPTPLVSWGIKYKKLNGGVVITSSHNPFNYNGFKIKDENGSGLSKKNTDEIENIIKKGIKPKIRTGKIRHINLDKEYMQSIKKNINIKLIKQSKMKIVLDTMFGSGSGYIEKILYGYKNLFVINNYRNPLFEGVDPEPIEKNLQKLKMYVKKNKADIGLAIDGDGDRMGVITDRGIFLSSHKTLFLLILHHIKNKKMNPKIIRTISGTFMIDKLAKKYNLEIKEKPVGFKYIAEEMIKNKNIIGGEESGGFGFGYYMPERDGIFSSLLFLEFLAKEKKKVSEILNEIDKTFGKYRYNRIDYKFKEENRKKINLILKNIEKDKTFGKKQITKINKLDGIKFIFSDNDWILFRFSGTEPLLRIYSESFSEKEVINNLNYAQMILKKYKIISIII